MLPLGDLNMNKMLIHRLTISTHLYANLDELGTRLVVHCVHSTSDTIVVYGRDTDSLIFLLAHFPKMNREYLWMITVTAKKRNYILTHEVYKTMPVG